MQNPPVNGQCFCSSPNYLDPVSLTCVACNLAIANCLTCGSTIPTTCLTSVSGTYISTDQTQVIGCPQNCASCDITGCISPNPGYTLTGSTISCDSTCTACLSGTIAHCTLCLAGPTCGGCENGYYLLSSTSCSPCPIYCLQCTSTGTCLSCNPTFNLAPNLQCTCNSTLGLYLNSITNQCETCSSVILGCKTCSATTPTTCSICADGYYWASSTNCSPCGFPCKTCSSTSPGDCLSCLGNYVHVFNPPSSHSCDCLTSPYLWVSNVTQNCEACSTIVPNCLTCITMGSPTYTGCSLCDDPYYADSNGNCILCPVTCTSCTDVNACSACANNLVIYGSPIGDCVPATLTNSTLTYYGPTNSAVSCLLLLSNCQTCSPSPLACSVCTAGTFLNGTICQNCDPSCATCDSTGCTSSCPPGLTLNGTVCECTGTCLIC
jgi:proprotein convertase subtilisin/kexin type 5